MRIALVQMNSTRDFDANLEQARRLIARAAGEGAELVALPENAPFLGRDSEKRAVASDEEGAAASWAREAAREHAVWVVLGSYPEIGPDPERTYNTQLVIDPGGEVRARYRKLHLFDVELPGGASICESASVAPGDEIVDVAIGPEASWRAGLSVCYDLRFPELYRRLTQRGAEILTVPAAFTAETGPPHWRALLRARAIENQCYVVAPNQCGTHFEGRASWGHSVVFDPWGDPIAELGHEPGVAVCTIDRARLEEVRAKMPCASHRRRDLF